MQCRHPECCFGSLNYEIINFRSMHRDVFCQFPFRCIYYYGSNKSNGTGKMHLCAMYTLIAQFNIPVLLNDLAWLCIQKISIKGIIPSENDIQETAKCTVCTKQSGMNLSFKKSLFLLVRLASTVKLASKQHGF